MVTDEHINISRLDTSDWMGFMVNKPTPLKFGSLFAGVGGFDMGFDQAGYDCVFQVEWDKNCLKVLHHHWPTVPKWGDVCDVNGAELPPCDVLIFGSPCQDLSVAGKRAGLEGDKSSMFFEAIRIIKEMRDATKSIYPRVVVWENVPGALSSNNGADFGEVLDTLAECGAVDIQWAVLDAQHFGVPQRRRRVFVVAIFDLAAADNCPETLLPVIKGSRGDFKKSRTARKNATGHATPSVDSSSQWAAGSTDEDILSTSVCSKWAKGSGGPSGSEHYNMVVESEPNILFGEGSFAQFVEGQVSSLKYAGGNLGGGGENLVVPFVESRRAQSNTDDETWVEGVVTPTLNAFDNGYNQKLDDSGIHRSLRIGRDSSDFVAQPTYAFDTQFGSNAAVFEDQSPTLKSSQQPPSVSPLGLAVRRLTPLECERLMGWPDDHTRWTADGKEQADTNRYKQCGNGVATPVAKWVAGHIRLVLEM